MSISISSVIFHHSLNSQRHEALQNEIKRELDNITGQLHSTLRGPWEVNVWFASDNEFDWVEAGMHKFYLAGAKNDDETYVQSLVASWHTMLRICKLKPALAFAINRPGALKFENPPKAQEESASVAKAEEDKLTGEWMPENPRYARKQWIVSDKIAQSFDDAVTLIKNSDKIYKDWGFEEVDPNPRAVLCFYGPAGTGKTMAAHVLASELGRKIISAKYSQIESKYVGDAPKNLKRVFDEAKETEAILFFDEADSFLGKRMENVSSGSEQAINSLRGEMLILLEEFRGVVVFATNLLTNIDRAFESRIISKIEFEMPNAEARRAMILSKIPAKAPLESGFGDAEVDKLVDISEGFSGRVIRSAMLMSFVKAAKQAETRGEDVVLFADFEQAFKEQKETAENIEKQYNSASGKGGFEIPESEQQPLLDIAAERIAQGDCEQVKIN